MTEMPKRDLTGECEGECRDRIREGEVQRQAEIEGSSVHTPDSFPNAPGAKSRNEPPGFYGGHV